MKKTIIAGLALSATISCAAQDITLPQPETNQKTLTLTEALATRHSVREYSNRPLTMQEISNLCWAANGVSRDADHRTAPSAMNRKEIRLFVFTAQGTYEYIAQDNKLSTIDQQDNRALVAGTKGFSQDFVLQAPVSLVMVIDFDLFGQKNERAVMMGCVDAGNVSENINLYCQAAGLATVPRATMDTDGIRKALHLTDNQLPIMNNPVGFSK